MENNPAAGRDPIVSGQATTSTPSALMVTASTAKKPETLTFSQETQNFLDHFDGLLTWQTFDDSKREDKNSRLARILHSPSPAELITLNDQGAGVFLQINEGDGQGRKNTNITRVRGYFADFDGSPLPATWPLEPSIITETSPNRYHAYWLLAEGQTAPVDNTSFNAQQKIIARTIGAQENDATGLARVMRVPGFLHQKGKTPFQTRIISISGLRYDLADIQRAFPIPEEKPRPTRPQISTSITLTPENQRETQQKYALTALEEECSKLASTTEGSRNNVLNGVAYRIGRLVSGGHIDHDEAHHALLTAARNAGLPDNESTATITSGLTSGMQHPEPLEHVGTRTRRRQSAPVSAGVPTNIIREVVTGEEDRRVTYTMPPMPEGVQEGTDAANAVILAANDLQGVMRYTPGLEWCVYRPERGVWETSANSSVCCAVAGQVLRGAVGAHLAALISQGGHKEDIERAYRWSRSVCQVQTVNNALKAAAGMDEFFTSVDVWDAKPDLLNCKNGVLELKTGVLRPHVASDYLTWQAGAAYRPDVTHPLVDQLIDLLRADGREVFLQRSVGSALYGVSVNETLTVLEGEGGTGKGTLCNSVMAMLGDYAHTVEISLLLAVQHGEISTGPKPELLALRGRRLVIAGEPPKGARFNSGRVKSLTGNDPITARRMHSDTMITYTPIFKLWLQTNYEINVSHDDSGMRRRLQIVPFTQRPTKADPNFKRTLQSDPDALSALLNWAYEGFRAWYTSGYDLAAGDTVEQATGRYWASQNVYQQFADECLILHPDAEIPSAMLKLVFEDWADEQGLKLGRDVRMPDLYAFLTQHGCEAAKGAKGARKWVGVTKMD